MILYTYNNGRIEAREDSPGVFNVYQLMRRIFGRSYDEKRIANACRAKRYNGSKPPYYYTKSPYYYTNPRYYYTHESAILLHKGGKNAI